MPTHTYYDLRDALALPGCPVCRLQERYLERAVGQLLYENVNNAETRERIRASRGFCREHAWYLDRRGVALEVALIMRDVLREVSQILAAAPNQQVSAVPRRWIEAIWGPSHLAARDELVAALGPQEPCPLCVYSREIEETSVRVLRQNLTGENALLERYAQSDGLCLPHFRQLLGSIEEEELLRPLMETQHTLWQKLDKALGELIVKSDYRFQHEPLGEEADAWRRALAAVSGEKPRSGEA